MIAMMTASLAALALAFGSALGDGNSSADPATTIRSIESNPECVAALSAANERGVSDLSTITCTATVVTSSGPSAIATLADLETRGLRSTSDDLSALYRAVAAGVVKSKPYSQTISQITDRETQKGTFYYDGVRAWVTETYRGYTGNHTCNVDYAVGYSVSNTACSDSGSPSFRKLQMNWAVALAVKGGPIAWTESFTMHVGADGSISNG